MPPTADLTVEGLVLDIDRFASHDGPGIRTTVFLKGCPLSCSWCHSPESRAAHPELLYQAARCTACWLCIGTCPVNALSRGTHLGQEAAHLDRSRCTGCGECVDVCYPGALQLAGNSMAVGALVEKIERDIPYFRNSGGGVTVSGGEPARQHAFTYHLLLACQERGVHTAMETTGFARWDVISTLASVTDLLLYDVKLIDPVLHRRYTGVPNRLILDNLRRLASARCEIQVRVPCIPGINDSPEQIQATARVVAGFGIGRIALLPYNGAAGAKYEWIDRAFSMPDTEPQSDQYMRRLADICQSAGLEVQVGG